MDRDETLAVMTVLKAAYPRYYQRMTRRDAEAAVALWERMFAQYSAAEVGKAVDRLIREKRQDFPPSVGDVMSLLPGKLELTEPAQDRKVMDWYEKHVARCRELGIPTAVEAKKMGMSSKEWGELADERGL